LGRESEGDVEMKRVIWASGALVIILWSGIMSGGCGLSPGGGDPPGMEPIEESTIEFVEQGEGCYKFYTNERSTRNWNIWKTGDLEEDPMEELQVRIVCNRSCESSTFGVIFCARDNDNFLALFITRVGYCGVFKTIKTEQDMYAKFYALVKSEQGNAFIPNAALRVGFTENRIQITHNAVEHKFRVVFNGEEAKAIEFTDLDDVNAGDGITEGFYSGGNFGYIVAVSSEENFPENSLELLFYQEVPLEIGITGVEEAEEMMSLKGVADYAGVMGRAKGACVIKEKP
jgi:hypothetical protein